MARGFLEVTLRPIKLAFLVDASDKEGFLEAVKINTALWGGIYNSIIPVYTRKPKILTDDFFFKRLKNNDILQGYLNAYDPDYVVPIGSCAKRELDIGNREKVDYKEIIPDFKNVETTSYGVSILEVLRYFYEKELKFKRRKLLEIYSFNPLPSYRLFLASVFGDLPNGINKLITEHYKEPLELKDARLSIANYQKFLPTNKLFIRRIGSFYVKPFRPSSLDKRLIFFMDASSLIDIIDYWNLRALGLSVFPVPKQVSSKKEIKEMVLEFIEESFRQHRYNPQIYYSATLQKSRTVTESEAQSYLKSLGVKLDKKTGQSKISARLRYPRIWDDWARDKDGVECSELESDKAKIDIPDITDEIPFKTLDPEFIWEFNDTGQPRFANEIDLRVYGDEEVIAEVLPKGDASLANAIGGYGLREWRLSKKGLVYLSKHKDWTVYLPLPKAEEVMLKWFSSLGWDVRLSEKGRVGKQLLRHLGGIWGLSTLANEELLQLIGRLTGQKKLLASLPEEIKALRKALERKGHKTASKKVEGFLKKIEDANLESELATKPIPSEQLRSEIGKALKGGRFRKDPISYLERLTEVNMFKLGARIKCPVCEVNSWYSLSKLDYNLQCPNCLSEFKPPTHSPKDIQWAYRTSGPFSLPNLAVGNYSVLLTLRFFSKLMHSATTPLMSSELNAGDRELEIDLALLFSRSRLDNKNVVSVFVECKSFNDKFDEKDIEKLDYLGQRMPGATLAFSTLRRSLNKEEIMLLAKLVRRNRRNRLKNKPYNSVLILTGTELFADSEPPYSWEQASKRHKKLAETHKHIFGIDELSDATQQLYLGLKPWHEELTKYYEKREKKERKKKPISKR